MRPDIRKIADELYETAKRQLETTELGLRLCGLLGPQVLEAWLRNVAANQAYVIDNMLEDLAPAI